MCKTSLPSLLAFSFFQKMYKYKTTLTHPSSPCISECSQKFITNTCVAIANKLRGKAGRKRVQQPTPGEQKYSWAEQLLTNTFPDLHPPWVENPTDSLQRYRSSPPLHNENAF